MTAEQSTGLPLASLRPIKPSQATESPSDPPELSTPSRLPNLTPVPVASRKLLDFDIETVAAGYADPQWVPSTVTAWAYSWGGDIVVEALPVAKFYDVEARRRFLEPLIHELGQADVVTGHNVLRFDLPVLQAEVMRLGMPSLPPLLVQDTIRLPRSKGFKKGQDNLGVLLAVPVGKLPLNFQQWAEAYAEPDLGTVKDRVAGDVRQHMLIREAMRDRGWLTPPRRWQP
jgi:DNA polymerase elongation subunit (family B)